MKRIAITGISGYLGLHLARELDRDPDVECILGLDLQPPSAVFRKLTFVRHDITEPFGGLFLDHWIDTAIHLVFRPPADDRETARRVNLTGTDRMLEACHRAGVQQVALVSCASVYGPGQAQPLHEDAPLRGGLTGPGDIQDRLDQEARWQTFGADHPEVHLLRVRPASILGPGASSPLARTLARRPLLLPRRMPALQVCHVEDVARAVHQLLKAEARGVFNVAPDDAVAAEEVGRVLDRRTLRLPRRALEALSRLHQVFDRGEGSSTSPDTPVLVARPDRISSRRLQQEVSFRYRYSSRQTLELFASGQGIGQA